MKIAIVGPSPVPFTVGGVENLLWGMCEWMNQNTEHQVELIKLPSREYDMWSLIETYESFYNLNLDYFDIVISTKYPAWMVKHKNHICYLQHRLRGLYDTYHFTNLPQTTKRGNPHIDRILDYIKTNKENSDLNEFFCMLKDLKNNSSNIPKEYLDFPSPFIREIIHYLDSCALNKNRIRKFLCISNTVKQRLEYFPENCEVSAVHHPSNLKEFSRGEYEYLFVVSRLDGPKRLDLLIEAMKYVKNDIKLYIAGTGPQEELLKSMAKDDKRIEFLGFVTDKEVEEYYKNSLVIPYFPYDEDYGLITIEAMMHAKPVITTVDAGGPTEFVRNNETGFIVKTTPKDVAKKIEYFANNKEEAKRMGLNAFNLASKITWENVCTQILSIEHKINLGSLENRESNILKRKKITVTSTFSVYPPQGGGQSRIFNLYKSIAKEFNVEIVSLTNEANSKSKSIISEGLVENRISKSQKHAEEEWKIESKVGVPITDVVMPLLINYTPEYINELKDSIFKSDIVVISHPYMYTAAEPYLGNKFVVYEAHNVEYTMKKEMLPNNESARNLVELTYEIEKKCCDMSNLIITCSEEDKTELSRIYSVDLDKIIVVPNGVDVKNTKFVDIEQRIFNKSQNALSKEKVGLFMGSWHGPNLEAAEEIIEISKKCKKVKFMLMGSQCMYFKDRKLPENVGLLGLVSEEEKNRIFSIVDFALNPMISGSGTNLKMFDYMAAGIPVITTEFGTRGIDDKSSFIIKEVNDMVDECNSFKIENQTNKVVTARKYVEETFDWNVIASIFIDKIYSEI